VNVGTYQDALFENAPSDESISIDLTTPSDKEFGSFDYEDAFNFSTQHVEARTCEAVIVRSKSDLSIFNNRFRFLMAERIGPRVSHLISESGIAEDGIGNAGEYTAEFLNLFGDHLIRVPECRHPKAVSNTIRHNVEAWMSEFSPNFRLMTERNSGQDTVRLSFQYETARGLSNSYRPTNVGFGVSYTLPVVTAILSAEPNDLILLEAPEAHLHPRGQSKIGELISLAAEAGVQIIVETHSDHVLNGVRVAIHQRKLSNQKTAVYYFQWNPKREDGATTVQQIPIDEMGRIAHWPEGFFDELENSLEILLGPQPEI